MKPAEFKWGPLSRRQKMVMTWWADGSPYQDYDGIIADGAIRSGKSVSMSFSFVLWGMTRFNRCDFGLCGKTIGTLRRNVLGTLKRQLRAEGFDVKERSDPNRLVVGKGGRLNTFYLFGGKDESSQDLVQGATLAGVFFDEVALMPESFVNQATARCSVDGSKFWFNCNPSSPLHWFRQNWMLQNQAKRLVYLHFTMADNLTLTARIRERYEAQYVGVFYDRYIRGLWVTAEGLVYDCFDERKHVISREALPETEGPFYVSSDYGIQNANVWLLWRRIKGSNAWICLKESYYSGRDEKRQKTDEELARLLTDMLGSVHPYPHEPERAATVEQIIIDPSAASMISLLRRMNLAVRKANNDVMDGIADVSTMLSQGRLFFSDECRNTIGEFGMYVWDEKAVQRGEDAPVKQHDHGLDATRYFVKTMQLVRRADADQYRSILGV